MKPAARSKTGLLLIGLLGLLSSPAAAWPPDRLTVTGGPAYDFRRDQGASFLAPALGHDYPLARGSRFVLAPEVYPLILLDQRSHHDGKRRLNAMVAGTLALAYNGSLGRAGAARLGFRVELGSGLSWAVARPVPSGGTRFNFYDQGGLHLNVRLANGRAVSVGYRRVHLSNLALFEGKDNPGITFHALSAGYAWD